VPLLERRIFVGYLPLRGLSSLRAGAGGWPWVWAAPAQPRRAVGLAITRRMSYSFSLAPTNRATCKGKCKAKIEKDSIRLGTAADGAGDYQMVSYRCVHCITKKQFDNIVEKLGSVEDVPGFLSLNPADQQKIKDAAAAAVPPPKPVKKAKTAADQGSSSSSAAAAVPTAPAAPPPPPPSIGDQHLFADAAKRRDWTTVKSLLDSDAGYINVQPAGRWTALHQFSQAGNAEAVSYLLSKGADKMAKTKEGKTPLEVAHASIAPLLSTPGQGASSLPAIPLAEQHKFCDYARECDFEQVRGARSRSSSSASIACAARAACAAASDSTTAARSHAAAATPSATVAA
jgi:hypothetical protein